MKWKYSIMKVLFLLFVLWAFDSSFASAAFRFREKQWEFLQWICFSKPRVSTNRCNFSWQTATQISWAPWRTFGFPVCYSGYTLTEGRHKALPITQSTGKMMGSQSIHPQAPELHKEAYGWCAGGAAVWTEVVYVCIWSAGMDCHISHKVVAFLQDKNKHCNLAEWAVWYNFINLNGLCGLRQRVDVDISQFINLSSST